MAKEEIHEKSREKEFHCYGTTRIFEKRANKLKSRRTWITFLGIVTPVVIGGTVLSFGANSNILPYFLIIAGIVGLVQLVLSTWSIVARWDEAYEYAIESARDNTELYNIFKKMADSNSENLSSFNKAVKKYEEREFKDIGQSITDKEKRYANRISLMYYKKPCHVCNDIPKSISPTSCDSCGNF